MKSARGDDCYTATPWRHPSRMAASTITVSRSTTVPVSAIAGSCYGSGLNIRVSTTYSVRSPICPRSVSLREAPTCVRRQLNCSPRLWLGIWALRTIAAA